MVRIATRASRLARWQADWVKTRLADLGVASELVLVETQGDREQAPFAAMDGQGFFTKAVQDAVLAGRADLAVHSYKDLPSEPAAGLEVAAVSERADPRDVIVARPDAIDDEGPHLPLRQGVLIGTSAARRRAQLMHLRPDLRLGELRGNVPTRVERLRNGDFGAVILAAAGLERLQLDLSGVSFRPLDPREFLPAPAQGSLALEIRREDHELASILTDIHDVQAHRTVAAERGLMAMIHGGCQLALGCHAALDGDRVTLEAFFEGRRASATHASSEGAAMLVFEGLGRPRPREVLG